MNWVGGTLSRIRGRDDKKIQREFFEKKRYEKTLDSIPIGMQSPTKKKELAISQDLLSLHTVLQTHSETNNRLYRQFKHPNMLDLRPKAGLKRTISFEQLQEPVLNEKYHTRAEGFHDLDTPSSLLDVKKWRGEYKQGKTLGMSKAALCLRQFQEQEQEHAVFQREGVDECGKENIPLLEGQVVQENTVLVGMEDKEDVVKKGESCMHWNSRVCEESEKAPGNSKWLEFLYGTNKTNSKPTQPVSDNQHADHIIQHPAVQLPPLHPNTNLSDIPKQPTGNMEVYNTEDLMEFEREKMIRRQPGQSEDPFYLTLTSNRDSLKGYKRPRIDPISSSGSSAVTATKDKFGGFLEESVFATPTDESILRPDGMLTENPLPYSNRSGMRSIKDFIVNKTLKYDRLHDALTDEEMEEIDGSAEDSENSQTTNNIPIAVPTKSRFVVPFAIKEQSPIPIDIPKEEQRSYDRFLNSLVAPDATSTSVRDNAECGSGLIPEDRSAGDANTPQSINDKIDSLMMPILKWKEKETIENNNSENSIESIPVECDEYDKQVDKESTTNTSAGSITTEQCYEESIVRENSNTAEKSFIEAELNERGIDVVEIDENSADLMSGNNTQDSNNELIGESVEVILEDQNNITEVPKLNVIKCNIEAINGSVDEIKIDHALEESDAVKEIAASPHRATQLETVIEETDEKLTEVPEEINTIEPIEIATDEIEMNKLELINNSQMEVDTIPEEIATYEPREEDESVVISNSINESTNQDECTQESEQIVAPNNEMEYSDTSTDCIIKESNEMCSTLDTGVQYSQQSQETTAEDKDVDCTLATETESKECQTILQVNDEECQTSSFVTDGECQTDSDYSEPKEESRNMESREIQTEEEIVVKIEDKLTHQYTQTEETTHNNNGSQTDILLIRFPIEGKEQNNYDQCDYENFILYQQQIIKALQRELEMSNL